MTAGPSPLSVRQLNRLRVIETIYRHPATSRAELTRHTGLARQTVSTVIDELLGAGIEWTYGTAKRRIEARRDREEGRLAAQEREEIEIISAYLPRQLSDIEAGEAISALIKELEAATLKDMGRTMAALKERFAGRMDTAKASAIVKKLLGGG